MKKLLLFMGVFLLFLGSYSQSRITFSENFDGKTQSFKSIPADAWIVDSTLSVSGKNSCWGFIPNTEGDTVILESPLYDLTSYTYAYLRFTHICKVLENDLVTVEFREDHLSSKWKKLPANTYRGSSLTYRKKQVFNDMSYDAWMYNDFDAEPNNSWWKTENFDVSQEVSYARVQFRFKIAKGSKIGSQFVYGWLIDNFELIASTNEINPPIVELMDPLIDGKVFGTGPYQIVAKAAKQTSIPLFPPMLRMTYILSNGTTLKDSTFMTAVAGDTVWVGTIPQQDIGTHVNYSVYASDSVGNDASVFSSYYIDRKWGFDSSSVAITYIDTPQLGAIAGELTPITVTIENRGLAKLTSAELYYRLNGILQPSTSWTGNLKEGFSEQVTIGSYTPQMGKYDTIIVWVSMPNGEVNSSEDTILLRYTYGCSQILGGDYIVGTTGQFATINEALDILNMCGTAGNVNLKLQDGEYTQTILLHDLNEVIGEFDILTITSLSGNAADVVLKGESSYNTVISLARSHNIIISHVTIDATEITRGIDIRDSIYNVEITHCNILLDTMTKRIQTGINKDVNTKLFDKLRITHNVIDGGYYGIFLNGLSVTDHNTNLYIEHNVIKNPYYMSIYLRYCDFHSISKNQLFSRLAYAGSSYTAIYVNYGKGKFITKNKIRSYRTIGGPTALNLSYFNHLDTINIPLIANNEIILHFKSGSSSSSLVEKASAGSSVTLSYITADVIHNSILKTGGNTAAALIISNPIALQVVGNSVVVEQGLPVQFTNAVFGTNCYMDYNNYYSMQDNDIARIGTATTITSLSTWIATCGQDSNTISMLPHYIDTSQHLMLTDYVGLEAPVHNLANDDILDSIRIGITAIGCYTPPRLDFDVLLLGIKDWSSSTITNQSTPVKPYFMNIGLQDTLYSVTVNWSVNGTTQTPYQWTGVLPPYADTTLDIGSFVPQAAYNYVKIWLSDHNGQHGDMNTKNDTLNTYVYACSGTLSGDYTVGLPTDDFVSISEAFTIASYCGISDPVRFLLSSGEYYDIEISGIIPGTNDTNTITLLPASGNRDDVVLKGMEKAVVLTSTSYLVLDNLTIDANDILNAILLNGSCSDIDIRNCYIILDTTTKDQQFGIYCNNDAGVNHNLRIVNNTIIGGHTAVHLQLGSTTISSTGCVLDSNTLLNQYTYATSLMYADMLSVSNNYIKAREAYISASWNGIRVNYGFVRQVTSNKIYSYSEKINTVYGMYIASIVGTIFGVTPRVANNEIVVYGNSTNTVGLYFVNSDADILHNSVLVRGIADGRALLFTNTAHRYTIKNNIFMTLAGMAAFPIHVNAITNLNLWSFDYNNYYSNGLYIGFAGANMTTLAAWKATITKDVTSVSVMPNFTDIDKNLRIHKNVGISCPALVEVPYDIDGRSRNATTTTMGAYEETTIVNNASLLAFTQPTTQSVIPATNVDVSVVLSNKADSVLNNVSIAWEANGVTQTTYNWTGSLLKGETDTIHLGSFNVTIHENTILAYTSSPNGQSDEVTGDDTITLSVFGCASPLSGTLTVGSVTSDYITIESALQAIHACKVGGPITLSLAQGMYKELLISGAFTGASATNTITFTSATGNPEDVVIGVSNATKDALVLENVSYLRFSNVTIGTTNKTIAGLSIKGTLRDVKFDNCFIQSFVGYINTFYVPVYRDATATALITGLDFDKCTFKGGYYNFSMTNAGASASSFGDIRITNSNFLDAYNAGIHTVSANVKLTIKNNYFENGTDATSYVGMRFGQNVANTNIDTCSGNKMRLNATSANTGIFIGQNLNYNGPMANTHAYIANNEIIITDGSSTNYGVQYNNQCYFRLIGNSIYINSSATNAYGFHFADAQTNRMYPNYLEYNNFYVNNTGGSYTVFHSATSNVWSSIIMLSDYNNYYTTGPYVAQNYTTLKAWKTAVAQDYHSLNEKLNFVNYPHDLRTDGKRAIVPVPIDLPYDISDSARIVYTNVGCYHDFTSSMHDAAMQAIISPTNGIVVGSTADVKVQIANTGSILDSVEIHWSINGVLQPVYHWYATSALSFGELSDTLHIGSFIPISGENKLIVWTQSPNGSADGNIFNDTIIANVVSCDSTLQGVYTVGGITSDFRNMEAVMDKLEHCAISGPIVFEIQAGTYADINIQGIVNGGSPTNTITFTSANGRASSVVIGVTSENAMFLKNTSHLRFTNITIGSTGSNNLIGVKMEGYCEDIVFYGCNIFANSVLTTNTPHAVYYQNAANVSMYLKDIFFVKNTISGGYYNMNINYAAGATTNMVAKLTSVTIDSNVLSDGYYGGIYSNQVAYYPSISYNQITGRTGSTGVFYGIYLPNYNTVESCVSNKIYMTNKSTGYGIHATNLNKNASYGATAPCLVANNEIYGSSDAAQRFGIYRTNGQWNLVNNSIYLEGTTTNYGIYLNTAAAAERFTAKNNIIVVRNGATNNYAVYGTPAANVGTATGVFLNYNSYYSSSVNMLYGGVAYSSLSAWTTALKQDSNTIVYLPAFKDVTKNLSLSTFDNVLICNKFPNVDVDIENNLRTSLTIRGAYATPLYEGFDLALESLVEPVVGAVECFPDFTPIKVMLYNQGIYTADFSTDLVTLHFSCVSDSVNVQSSVVINVDSLQAMDKRVYEVYPLLDILYPGTYQLKVWMDCNRDEQAFNDTLLIDYYVEKSILPYDNDFSWVGAGVAVNQIHGDIKWGLDQNTPIAPIHGHQSMLFKSSESKGSISQSIFPSIVLQGTYRPRMQFWYLHDDANPTLRDHIEVKISLDGGANFTLIDRIYRYHGSYTTPSWVPYQYDLSSYSQHSQGSCVIVTFTAYSYGGGDQAIDRIRIVAAQDMELTMIPPNFDDFVACELDNKSISVVIENLTTQPIPYNAGDSITLEITGANPRTVKYHLVGKLEGLAKDTIEIATDLDFSISGTYDIIAYTNAIDSIQTNDTDRVSYTYTTDIAIDEILSVGMKDAGDTVYPTVILINKGTIPVVSPFDISYNVNGKDTVTETISMTLEVGDTLIHTFADAFIVPTVTSIQPYYFLHVLIDLPCDGVPTNDRKQYLGEVYFHDLSIQSVKYPTENTYLKAGEQVYVEAYIYNRGTFDSEGVTIHVRVDSAGVPVDFYETSVAILADANVLHTFTTPYIVPTLSTDSMKYTVTVYLEAGVEDVDLSNDTLQVETYALNDVSVGLYGDSYWTLGQNIPNPSVNQTYIPFSVPVAGEVTFEVTTINGQVLHREKVQASVGSHSFELSTESLANGIYYYSMEYQGKRIVKKMTIQK